MKMRYARFFKPLSMSAICIICCTGLLAMSCARRSHTPISYDSDPDHGRLSSGDQLIGFWFRGLNLVPGTRDEIELVGLLMHRVDAPADQPLAPPELLSIMNEAPIIASFRSAREAWFKAEALMQDHETSVQWHRAIYAGTWTFVPDPPPLRDSPLPGGACEWPFDEWPLGTEDSGLKMDPVIHFLPPPLQQRGIAVASSRPKANPARLFVPQDLVLSVFVSWADIETRVVRTNVEAWYWEGANKVWLQWADRARLR